MTTSEFFRILLFCAVAILGYCAWPSDAKANSNLDYRLYFGVGWTHFSNFDAGYPFNDDFEDNADHYGLELEYQIVGKDEDYFYITITVGRTKFNSADGNYSGWDCSGCNLPGSIRIGHKWKIF